MFLIIGCRNKRKLLFKQKLLVSTAKQNVNINLYVILYMEGVYYSLISVKESCKINSVIEHATNFEIIMKYKVFEKKIDN